MVFTTIEQWDDREEVKAGEILHQYLKKQFNKSLNHVQGKVG